MAAERLQKLLARAGIASRREAESLIAAGRVRVDGAVVALGSRADPEWQQITLDGAPLPIAPSVRHYAVYKPRGMLSSSRDERGRRSVVALLPTSESGDRLWPAGRLDVDSEGLMLLTNDGAWANRVLHPRYGLEREYAVLVDRPPTPTARRALLDGVELDDGVARLLSVAAAPPPPEVQGQPDEIGHWLRVVIAEGRKREVRRIFAAVGASVGRLVRVRLGPLSLGGLGEGQWRRLSAGEVAALAGRRLTIAIDGPSGSGKSTVGHALAERLGASFVDTGLFYRALTLAAIERGIDPEHGAVLGRLAREARIRVRRPRAGEGDRLETVLLGDRDVTEEVRTPPIDRAVSAVSRHAAVRSAMLGVQRATATDGPTVMVGRDIGTVVLPDASLKVYLTAAAAVRAARRAAEMGDTGRAAAYRDEIERRDALDSGRAVAPLRQAPDALVLDTGALDVAGCVAAIVAHLPPAADEP